jgi:uncharacterized membrane protein YgdD (TMEM256/DUF423 family)
MRTVSQFVNTKGRSMGRIFFLLGTVFGGLAVAAGAFGAHSLKAVLSEQMLDVFETAVRYQMYHALALLVVGWAARSSSLRLFRIAGWMFVSGIALFSGSLYLMTLSGSRWLGAITPLGGLAFLLGWALLGWAFWKGYTGDKADC